MKNKDEFSVESFEKSTLGALKQKSEGRVLIVAYMIGALALFVLCHMFYVQIIKHNDYIEQANRQYVKIAYSPFERGSIYFSNRAKTMVPAAQIITKYNIIADGTQIKDVELTYDRLNSVFEIPREESIAKMSKSADMYEVLAGPITLADKQRIENLKLKGIIFERAPIRAYPRESIAAKVIGFVGYATSELRGMYGVERLYDSVLERTDKEKQVNFFAQVFNDVNMEAITETDRNEGDILLTLDAETSRVLADTLKSTQEKWGSEVVGGIVMDPRTGAIIAMDAYPSFDPNKYNTATSVALFSNELVAGTYEMGSIIKPLTVAAAVDAGLVTSESTYNDTGSRKLNTYTVRNYDSKARGITTVQTILDKSLNVGIVHLVELLGRERFQKYFKAFGFGVETGIDLPGEVNGLASNLDSDVFVDSATAGFGQGLASTPIQTIRALSIIANGGMLVTPHVVDSVIYKSGDKKKSDYSEDTRVLSEDAALETTRMLVHVVDHALKNGDYKMEHYSVGAKTGTAQIAKKGGGYLPDEYLHSFFGYFPAYDPKFIIFLFQVKPKGAEYASATLTDPFFELVKFLVSYYEVPPDR